MSVVIEGVVLTKIADGGWLASGCGLSCSGETPMMAYMNRLEAVIFAEYNKLIDWNYSLKSQKERMDFYRDDIQEVEK